MCLHVIYLSHAEVDKIYSCERVKHRVYYCTIIYCTIYIYYNCKPTLAHPCIYIYISLFTIVIVDRILELEPSKFQS